MLAEPAPGIPLPLRARTPAPIQPFPAIARHAVQRRTRVVVAASAILDACAVIGAYLVARVVRLEGSLEALGDAGLGRAFVLTAPVWLIAFAGSGLYDRSRLAAASEEYRRVLHAVSVSIVAVVMITFVADIEVSRGWLGALALASLAFVGVDRMVLRRVTRRLAARGLLTVPSLVVGTNDEARTIARILSREPSLGRSVVGFVSSTPTPLEAIDGRPVMGSIHEIDRLVRSTDAGAVVIAGTAIGPDALLELDRVLQPLPVEVTISPGLPHVAATRISVNPLDGLALLSLEKTKFSPRQALVKRTFDVIGAAILLVVAVPILFAVALAVRVFNGRPVFYRQVRVGEAGNTFLMYKFRTMVVDAHERRDELAGMNEAGGLLFKLRDDPRVTRTGRVLRRWGLDELPQLLNVLKGEMSLVGPRPALPDETEQYDDRLRERLRVKPGLTGLWQVKGRHELSFDDYVRYDLFYIENWSLGFDLYVILMTLPALLARGAR